MLRNDYNFTLRSANTKVEEKYFRIFQPEAWLHKRETTPIPSVVPWNSSTWVIARLLKFFTYIWPWALNNQFEKSVKQNH